jgi:hypothetical protein
MNVFRRKPLDLTPSQLQVYLHDEKQESYYVFVVMLTMGFVLSAKWPAFAPEYPTYGGLMLAGLGALFGVNVAHKWMNNKATQTESSETGAGEEDADEPPKPSPKP